MLKLRLTSDSFFPVSLLNLCNHRAWPVTKTRVFFMFINRSFFLPAGYSESMWGVRVFKSTFCFHWKVHRWRGMTVSRFNKYFNQTFTTKKSPPIDMTRTGKPITSFLPLELPTVDLHSRERPTNHSRRSRTAVLTWRHAVSWVTWKGFPRPTELWDLWNSAQKTLFS